jgi:hypothetical protein
MSESVPLWMTKEINGRLGELHLILKMYLYQWDNIPFTSTQQSLFLLQQSLAKVLGSPPGTEGSALLMEMKNNKELYGSDLILSIRRHYGMSSFDPEQVIRDRCQIKANFRQLRHILFNGGSLEPKQDTPWVNDILGCFQSILLMDVRLDVYQDKEGNVLNEE